MRGNDSKSTWDKELESSVPNTSAQGLQTLKGSLWVVVWESVFQQLLGDSDNLIIWGTTDVGWRLP